MNQNTERPPEHCESHPVHDRDCHDCRVREELAGLRRRRDAAARLPRDVRQVPLLTRSAGPRQVVQR